MTNPGRLLPVLFFSLLSFWPSFCFSDFLISTIPLPTTGFVGRRAAISVTRVGGVGSVPATTWKRDPRLLFTSVEISRHDCSSCVAKRAPESAGTAEMFTDPRGKATVNGFSLDDPPDAVRDECLTTR